jgi:cellobiose phosphorylase
VHQPAKQRLKIPLYTASDLVRRQIVARISKKRLSGTEEQPLRAELFSIRQLEQHAKALAGWHEVRISRAKDELLPRLRSNEIVLASTYQLISDAVSRGRRVTPAAEWFLDNYYLIEEQIRAARRHLPRAYSRELPRLINDSLAGYPRVYSIALELISHADGRVDGESLRAFVSAYQSVAPLRLGELWAIPIMLRLALLENLRRVAARISSGRNDREVAAVWIERILDAAAENPTKSVLVLADMVRADPPISNAFVAEFASRLHGQGPALVFPMTWLEQHLAEQNETIDHVFQMSSNNQAADQVSIGNSIGSLRFLGATDWRDFVESMSVVESTLATDPAGVYHAMDFATRDRYRHVVEALARRCARSEEAVALKAIDLANAENGSASASGANGQARHVGYYLINANGRRELERALNAPSSPIQALRRAARRFPLTIYLGGMALLTGAATWLVVQAGVRLGIPPWALGLTSILVILCASQLAITIVNWLTPFFTSPKILPRMDYSEGVPPEHRTVVAVPVMLSSAEEVDDLLDALEVRYLGNGDANIRFALISDFRDAPQEHMPEDEAILQRAVQGIRSLNARYGGSADQPPAPDTELSDDEHERRESNPSGQGPFLLFHRPRRWNAGENLWMGWERKRGKIEQFNAALRGDTSAFSTIVGDASTLRDTRYVIALDSDTQLPRDSARQLIGTMAHPLNRAHYDAQQERVTSGYGILQPRVGISMPSASHSAYAQTFAGEPGIDPYTHAVSDIYQDVFEEGSFVGKGIYDVDALQRSIGSRFPENRILSHDLLEGAHARSGLVSDVLLFEDYPASYSADMSRRHRWIRGDWQIASWLFSRVPGLAEARIRNPIAALSRWKIFDNLRRSIVPFAMLALLVSGWFIPGAAVLFTGFVVAVLLLPAVLSAVTGLLRRPADLPHAQNARLAAHSLTRQVFQDAFVLACLPYEAYRSIDAIARTAVRLFSTRRQLLEWRTSIDAQRNTRNDLAGFLSAMWIAPAAGIVILALLAIVQSDALRIAAPICVLWLAAPLIAWRLSQPAVAEQTGLSSDDRIFLRALARRTWHFFETFVGPDDNHLPPDNVQEVPPRGVAHRTSPTNIGLSLLANLGAYDFGYIGAGNVIQRTRQTLETIGRLNGHRGHLFNWYDTRTLEPLRPLYVSTVDSGNLAGHLLTLVSGLNGLADQPVYRATILSGLEDTLYAAIEDARRHENGASQRTGASERGLKSLAHITRLLHDRPQTLPAVRSLLQRVRSEAAELLELQSTSPMAPWLRNFEEQCKAAIDELNQVAPWIDVAVLDEGLCRQLNEPHAAALSDLQQTHRRFNDVSTVPTLAESARLQSTLLPTIAALKPIQESCPAEVQAWLVSVHAAIEAASERAAQRLSDIHALAMRCTELADVDYEFLYDKQRHLLAIGYNVADHRRDTSFYDLLASEARLASYVAVAQGKLPQEHWFSLGRQLTNAGGKPALLSWSGSMFEYLMPLLVMPTYRRTLLDDTCRAVVNRQIEYGRERGVPWGISESGFYEFDTQLNYQYRAFGVPGLGLKRGLADDLVVAPYATAMGLMIDPRSACANLRHLAADGRMGAYGFFEAIDYTSTRVPRGEESVTIQSYMVHHQGMAFLSLAYLLLDQPMQRRFMADPSLRATELLLQERVPKVPLLYPHAAEVSTAATARVAPEVNYRVFTTPNTPAPEVHLLSNGRYHVVVTASGGGYSRWGDLAVTRWREDPTCDAWGTFCYLRDTDSGEFWSSAYQPTLRRSDRYEAVFSQGRAEFRRHDSQIETHVEISVSPEDDIELRRVSLTNRGDRIRTIELTSYAEVVLATPAADAAHPAFSNLFVQTEIIRDRGAILSTRRPRSAGERPPWMMHLMTVHGHSEKTASYETARADFIGRGRSIADPAAMHRESLGDSEGSVLDPIVAIQNTISLAPGESATIHIVTGMSETRSGAVELIEKYHDRRLADRVFELAWTHSQVLLRQLDATEADIQLFGRLASSILYAHPLLRAPGSVIARNRRGQSGLWGYGISGDIPIVLLRISDQANIDLVRQMIRAHTYWRGKGLIADLVIWNEDQSGYRQSLQEEIVSAIASVGEAGLVDKNGGIFVRRVDQMTEEDKVLQQTVARVLISDTAGTLAEQMQRRPRVEKTVARFDRLQPRRPAVPVGVEINRPDLAAFNGIGGFTHDGREYVITTTGESLTPAPWANVLANAWFGTVISESGGAYTWCENAHSYRLTPWHNDPITDASGEAFYIRDEETGRYWSPTPLPARGPMPYTTRHGFGYSVFEYTEDGISSEMRVYVAIDAPIKFISLKVRNRSGRPRRVSLTGYFDIVMGTHAADNRPHIVTEVDPKTGAMLARNPYNSEFAERITFMDTSEAQRTVTGNRTEFIGRNGRLQNPACMGRTRLSGQTGAGFDPCMAMQVMVELADGQEREIIFTFGSGRNLEDARTLVTRFRGTGAAQAAMEAVWGYWNRTLGAVYVQTPDPSVNFLANGWLLYQVIACRMWARSGFYQSGGAFGFRDQLQDAMALVHAEPAILREQLLRSAAHQFREGDVQHWWHPPSGRGVRTRISDDYLWLPYAVCRYVDMLGDTGVLDEQIRFIDGRLVQSHEESYYDLPGRSEESATLYEHCVRAIRNGLRFGERGLPLMGCGDWNDGMNLVGEQGRGESVWLAFFLYDVLIQFAALAQRRSDTAFAEICTTQAEQLRKNIELHAWDGEWYRRAYFDDGQPLGASTSPECKIDSLPQSWSVLSRAGDPGRSAQAMNSMVEHLVRRHPGLIQLFDPPFDTSALNPGYIKGYVPGVRENGGQYTHAAVWAVMAAAASGDAQRAWDLFDLINPVRHGDSESAIAVYKVEPYVVAADVYTNPQHIGRGGWTWYTGSAGWMYRLITESLLGLRRDVDRLHIKPVFPDTWDAFDVHYRYRETFFHIHIRKAGGDVGSTRVTCDGVEQPDAILQLRDDRQDHHVTVEVAGYAKP